MVIVGRDAGAFGHAVAFADLRAEALFERTPDFARAATAPGDARAMLSVERGRRLLQQNLQDAAEKMDMARAAAAHLLPKTACREMFDQLERHLADQRQHAHLLAAVMIERIQHEHYI